MAESESQLRPLKSVQSPKTTTMKELLEETPLGFSVRLTDGIVATRAHFAGTKGESLSLSVTRILKAPSLRFFCPNPSCHELEPTRWELTDGPRQAEAYDNIADDVLDGWVDYLQLQYTCKACESSRKLFFVKICLAERGWEAGKTIGERQARLSVIATKVGEDPGFVPQYSKKLLRKLDEQSRELFYKGITSENLGCGLGSFAYYRRIVEDVKRSILNKLIAVAERMGIPGGAEQLVSIRDERQFQKAIEASKKLINELTYQQCCADLLTLHDVTSGDMHGGTDVEASETAKVVRELLLSVLRRVDQLQDDHDAEKKARDALNKIASERAQRNKA